MDYRLMVVNMIANLHCTDVSLHHATIVI